MRRRANLVPTATAAAERSQQQSVSEPTNQHPRHSSSSSSTVCSVQPLPALSVMYSSWQRPVEEFACETPHEQQRELKEVDKRRLTSLEIFRRAFGDPPQPSIGAVVERIRDQVSC